MGDIVKTSADTVELSLNVAAHAGMERAEIRNGTGVLETVRPYTKGDLGDRIRVVWSGAEYPGRGRDTTWSGRAKFSDAKIQKFEMINQWKHKRLFEQRGSNTVIWDTVTTGNCMGFDVWLENSSKRQLDITTSLGDLSLTLADTDLEDQILDAGGLDRKLKVFRMPNDHVGRKIEVKHQVNLKASGDDPLWVCVTTEDGYQA